MVFYQTVSSSFLTEWSEKRPDWCQKSLKAPVSHGNWGTLWLFSPCTLHKSLNSLLGKTTSWCFAIHSHLLPFSEVAKQGCWLWRAEPGPRGEHQLLWPHLSKGTIFYHWFHLHFSQYPHSEVADPWLPTPRQRGRMFQGHCVRL